MLSTKFVILKRHRRWKINWCSILDSLKVEESQRGICSFNRQSCKDSYRSVKKVKEENYPRLCINIKLFL